MTQTTTTKPMQVFRLRNLSASVFRNQAKNADRDVSYFKVSLQKTYRDVDGFHTTTSLSRDDLPAAQLLLNRAWTYILDSEEQDRKPATPPEVETNA